MAFTLTPDNNPLQQAGTDLLVAAVGGEIDLNDAASLELANRGLDRNGRWVGFSQAHAIHTDATTAAESQRDARAMLQRLVLAFDTGGWDTTRQRAAMKAAKKLLAK